MRPTQPLAVALIAAALAGCGTTASVTTNCPQQLVDLAEAAPEKRPAKPAAGAFFSELMEYRERADSYIDALLRQAGARESQVEACPK